MMFLHSGLIIPLLACLLPCKTHAYCHDPSPAFPLPDYDANPEDLLYAFNKIEASLTGIVSHDVFNASSFSIEVTSSKKTLWSLHHTARERNEATPGTERVDGASIYRIASITKAFTVLGVLQQHIAGNLSLDDSIDKYIPELRQKQDGSIPWKDITLRTLGSQLSGIPNDFAQSDLMSYPDPTALGLPPGPADWRPKCDEATGYKKPCGRTDLLDSVRSFRPIYPPKQQSTYCNIGFELLGLALENVTGIPYAQVIATTILKPLKMKSTSINTPDESVGVIPKGQHYWGVDEGVQNPTGGLYSTSTDLSLFLRYVLTHYNGLTPTLNWLHPASYAHGMHSFFGMPWEIFRTDAILPDTTRPVTFVTKSGGVPGYFSIIMALPEYDLGITILVAGNGMLLDELRETLTVPLVRAAEAAGQGELEKKYAGTYSASSTHKSSFESESTLNSSLTLSQTASRGLHVTSWISNGTDVLEAFGPLASSLTGGKETWRAQLVPTLLFRDEERQQGEVWRIEIVPEKPAGGDGDEGVWDDFCVTHVDNVRYAGIPLNEVVFWDSGEEQTAESGEGPFREIELSAFRIRLQRAGKQSDGTSHGRARTVEENQKVMAGKDE